MKQYTIQEIKNYILSQDSLGDVLYNLKEENIEAANIPKCISCNDRPAQKDYPLCFECEQEVHEYEKERDETRLF